MERAALDDKAGAGEDVLELAPCGDGVQVTADGGENPLLRVPRRTPRRLDAELGADAQERAALAVDRDRDHQVRDHRSIPSAASARPARADPIAANRGFILSSVAPSASPTRTA